jgi:hypothetical protein
MVALGIHVIVTARNLPYIRLTPLIDFHWERYTAQLEQGAAVKIPIYPAGWYIDCEARPKR